MFRKGKCIDIENIHISGCLGSGDDNEYCLKKHEGSFWNEVNVLNDCSGDWAVFLRDAEFYSYNG